MTEVLQDGHLRPQLALVLVREPQLVDEFDSHGASGVSVLACKEGEQVNILQ